MPLSVEDIVSKTFEATKFREGYDQDAVDNFLDEVAESYTALTQELEALRAGAPVAAPVEPVFTPVAPPATSEVSGLLALAQRLHDEYLQEAHTKAEAILNQAKAQAQATLTQAHAEVEANVKDLEERAHNLEVYIHELGDTASSAYTHLENFLQAQLGQLKAPEVMDSGVGRHVGRRAES